MSNGPHGRHLPVLQEQARLREEARELADSSLGWLRPTLQEEKEAELGPAFADYVPSPGLQLVQEGFVSLRGERPVRCAIPFASMVKGSRVLVDLGEGHVAVGLVRTDPERHLTTHHALYRALRHASDEDLAYEARNRTLEAEAVELCAVTLERHRIHAKVLGVQLGQATGRTIVQLSSEERLELRELSRILGQAMRARVELKLAGPRDSARLIGGLGPCGLQLCCHTFLRETPQVTLKMAKDQGLAPNPARVAGVCGKLMCCLIYEEAHYRAKRAGLPRPGRAVDTQGHGEGVVRFVDVHARTAVIALANGSNVTLPVDQLVLLHRANSDEATESEDRAPPKG